MNLWPDSQKERLLFGFCWQSLKAQKNASATLISVSGFQAPERRQLLVILKAAALNLWPDSQKERLPFGICWQSLKARKNASATLISVSGFQAPEGRQLLVILKAAALNLWPDSQKERLLFGICWQSLKAPKNASATLISVWKPLKDGSCL